MIYLTNSNIYQVIFDVHCETIRQSDDATIVPSCSQAGPMRKVQNGQEPITRAVTTDLANENRPINRGASHSRNWCRFTINKRRKKTFPSQFFCFAARAAKRDCRTRFLGVFFAIYE